MEQPQQDPEVVQKREYRNTIGSIVTGGIFRAALILVAALFLYDYFKWVDYAFWWSATAISLYAFVFHPMQIQYRLYKEETETVVTNSLCAKCKHFEPTGVLCSILDEHVTEDYLPCEGQSWEPKSFEMDEDAD
jgi:hypothetical protein